MISPISFKGTFQVDLTKKENTQDKINKLDTKVDKLFRDSFCYEDYQDSNIINYNVKDSDDISMVGIMNLLGLNFKKLTTPEVMSERNIKSRIVLDPGFPSSKFKIVEIDTKKFNKLYKKHGGYSYIGDKSHIDKPERTERFKEYLKTGKDINSSIVFVHDRKTYPEITFHDGRHRYAYYRDMGMKTIPVAMDKESIEVAKKYNLLA